MTAFRAAMLGLIGVFSLGYVAKSIALGVINLGGKGRDLLVRFADQPGLFLFGVLLMTLLGAGALLVAWRYFSRGTRD